jgi:hypothetical protein
MKECLLTPLGNRLEISTKRCFATFGLKSEFYMIRNVDARMASNTTQ